MFQDRTILLPRVYHCECHGLCIRFHWILFQQAREFGSFKCSSFYNALELLQVYNQSLMSHSWAQKKSPTLYPSMNQSSASISQNLSQSFNSSDLNSFCKNDFCFCSSQIDFLQDFSELESENDNGLHPVPQQNTQNTSQMFSSSASLSQNVQKQCRYANSRNNLSSNGFKKSKTNRSRCNISNCSSIDKAQLFQLLSQTEDEAEFYKIQYQRVKILNQSIIHAVKKVFSQELGNQVIKIAETNYLQNTNKFTSTQNLSQKGNQGHDPLTDTLYECFNKNKEQNMQKISQTVVQRPLQVKNTNKKIQPPKQLKLSLHSLSEIQNRVPQTVSPQPKSSRLIRLSPYQFRKRPSSIDSEQKHQISGSTTNRTNERTSIVTLLKCQICNHSFQPNDFFHHALACDKQILSQQMSLVTVSDVDSLSQQVTNHKKPKKKKQFKQFQMTSLIDNLNTIRKQIQGQIHLLKKSKANQKKTLQKKLQKELQDINRLIQNKEEQLMSSRRKQTRFR